MWLLLTILFAIATFLSALYFDTLIPAFLFLIGAIVFAFINGHKRNGGR
jgi:hypothetical protein